MMLLELIQNRRSIRKFQSKPVEGKELARLIEAALRAPSSRSLNPWEFVIVNTPELLEKLSFSKEHSAAFLKNAVLAIVVCASPDISDVWVEDASIAATYIQLTAESMGLGSCWVQIRNRMHGPGKTSGAYLRETLGIPEPLEVEAIIGIGHPNEHPAPHQKEDLPVRKVFYNRYGNHWPENE